MAAYHGEVYEALGRDARPSELIIIMRGSGGVVVCEDALAALWYLDIPSDSWSADGGYPACWFAADELKVRIVELTSLGYDVFLLGPPSVEAIPVGCRFEVIEGGRGKPSRWVG
jgi:hypothetical protein